jgi:dolichol-phosphate mannosyltransferase
VVIVRRLVTELDETSLSLILPTLNERENVVLQVDSILRLYPRIREILVVDDDSSDGTRGALKSHFQKTMKSGKLSVIHRRSDLGLTASLRDGVRSAKGKLIGWMDCDLSMPVGCIAAMLKKISTGNDIVVASRFLRGGGQKGLCDVGRDSRVEIVLSTWLNRILSHALRLGVTDLTSGFLIGRAEVLKKLTFRGRHGEYFLFLMVQAARLGLRVCEVPYQCSTRQHGISKTFGSPKAALTNSLRYLCAVFSASLMRLGVGGTSTSTT